jgi:hypothetical protein
MTEMPQPEMKAASGWGDTSVPMVGPVMRRLNFSADWHPYARNFLRSGPRPFNRPALAGAQFTGSRQHFI